MVPAMRARPPKSSVWSFPEDLRGLPPAYIDVGALDLFRDEDVRYALALLRGGVSTELRVIAGAYHGFERVVSAQVSLAAQRERRDALRRAFAR